MELTLLLKWYLNLAL